ncbi:hypothetical protein G7Y89_g13300 [Cudoniella acicularis]|uniref:DUF8004 domain-containing protein n=1 Tax=Cudoniella acicularis TaxID=354080 RepID=A0A8H4R7P1_9HELO|nr:hypothetical protein G7Y89_g13300 [Cudoniella acicularis]
MSGRSAYVRKEKTKVKDAALVNGPLSDGILSDGSDYGGDITPSIIGDFPMPMSNGYQAQLQQDFAFRTNSDYATINTGGSGGSGGSQDLAYARVRKPQVPTLDVSGIEKSTFRSLMDKKSEGVRKGLAKTFGKKKKAEEIRPPTSTAIRPNSHELDAGEYIFQPFGPNSRQIHPQIHPHSPEHIRQGPPQGRLPSVPQGLQLKRWMGSGRAPQPWSKLRKDPELWDPNGDTLVYFSHESQQTNRPPPSFKISSHIIENTDSRFLVNLLQEGFVDNHEYDMPPSPINSPNMRHAYPAQQGRQQQITPPMSDNSMGGHDGQISYEIYFPPPNTQSKTDTLRHQVTTRNVFAILSGASLVGLNFFQALTDLHERMEVYIPPDTDAAGYIVDYLVAKGLDDVRENPNAAAALLAWTETRGVRWETGWREAYVHCVGMYNRLDGCPEFKFVTPITRALLERASLELQVRIQGVEDRLSDFEFTDMWPIMTAEPPLARASFERFRGFLQKHYQSFFGEWPPRAPAGKDQWLTREVVQSLQKDFGSLYDYLVNRDIVWDCFEERSGRKWNIVNPGYRSFDVDTPDMPFTDILVAFDNRNKYPHIPHPYPLAPEFNATASSSRENLFKANSKRSNKPSEDRMNEKRAALAYTESTNIYLLGSDFVPNDLVDAFVKFEKGDRAGDSDLYAARRGRWVLIYGILQTLASVSVDTPDIRYEKNVSYHLSPRLRGTPPWKGANQNVDEANHVNSYCWTIRETWQADAPVSVQRIKPLGISNNRSNAPSFTESESSSSVQSPTVASSVRSPTLTSSVRSPTMTSSTRSQTTSSINSRQNRAAKEINGTSYSGYAPGFQKVEEWPIQEQTETRSRGKASHPKRDFTIKDFDDYQF